MVPHTVSEFRGLLETSRLFNGGISPARAGALTGFVYELELSPYLLGVPPQVIAEARSKISEKDQESWRLKFSSLLKGKVERPNSHLTEEEKGYFDERLLGAFQLPWKAQAAGAFLVFANIEEGEIPTAAAGLFPTLESFRTQPIEWASEYTGGWSQNRYNNFHLYFCSLPGNVYRNKLFFRRFSREEPERERWLTERVTPNHRARMKWADDLFKARIALYPKMPDEILPDFEPELYEAYKKMASYVKEIRLKEVPDLPWRVLIS